MKRSEINTIVRNAHAFFDQLQFKLPAWGYWEPGRWKGLGAAGAEIIDFQLGWDVTDFGSGNFKKRGLTLFTLRNGSPDGRGPSYAEKIMLVGLDQETPLHFHASKTEDIINRGGGVLSLQLWNSTKDRKLADTKVDVSIDGLRRVLPAGAQVDLVPGESIRLTTGLYHRFWGSGSDVMVGEVSQVNDDKADNFFLESLPRYPALAEDEAPWRLMVTDYQGWM